MPISEPSTGEPRVAGVPLDLAGELALVSAALRGLVRERARRRPRDLPLARSAAVTAGEAASASTDVRAKSATSVRGASSELFPRPRAFALPTLAVAERAPADAGAREIRERANACPDLASLRAGVAACTACGLCRTRTQTVFSDGTGRVRVMFVGEAPGESEDLQGVPFVGRAGALLSDIITKGMGLAREDVYIANVLKCRPPGNRDPTDQEKRSCTPWLDRQIELVDPLVIVPLGRHAAGHVLGVEASMGSLRGRVHERGGRKIVPTFHPAYLLRSPSMKKECWKDIQLAMSVLGLERPARPS